MDKTKILTFSDTKTCRRVCKAWRNGIDSYFEEDKVSNSVQFKPDYSDLFQRRQRCITTIAVPLTISDWKSLIQYCQNVRNTFIGKRVCLRLRHPWDVLHTANSFQNLADIETAVFETRQVWSSVEDLELETNEDFGDVDFGTGDNQQSLKKFVGMWEPILHRMENVKRVVMKSIYCGSTLNALPNPKKLEEIVEMFSANSAVRTENKLFFSVDWKKILYACHMGLNLLHISTMRWSLVDGLNAHVFPCLNEFYQKEHFPSYVHLEQSMPNLKILGLAVTERSNWISFIRLSHAVKSLHFLLIDASMYVFLNTEMEHIPASSESLTTVLIQTVGSSWRQYTHTLTQMFPSASIKLFRVKSRPSLLSSDETDGDSDDSDLNDE